MRNFKRFLAMTLTMLMVVACFVPVASAKFEDVTDFQNEITILSKLGVIKGKADGTFGFDEAVTRRQMALFVARAKTGKVDDTVWTSTVNNSQFKDLDATNDYYGAISYCANLDIIKGRTATAFFPNDNIIFQEAIAMVVRAIGYGSEKMDAGYPYTYYDKAVSLGLDKGIEDVALTDVVSRGVAAKLLFNAFFCINSDGTTMAAAAFGAVVKSTTVVIVAGAGKNLVGYNQPTAAGTVSFCEINADGTFNVARVYNLNWSEFVNVAFDGDTTKNAIDYVGASFDAVTIDGFATLATASCNPIAKFDQDKAVKNTIDGHSYTLVKKWSTVFNTKTTWSGGDEMMLFNTAFTESNIAGIDVIWYQGKWYLVDENYNILETGTHQILYYYMGNDIAWVTANAGLVYAKRISGNYYVQYGDLVGAATVDEVPGATYSYNFNADPYTTNVNCYSDTVAYDDDNDGLYERAYYTYYIFGKYTTSTAADGTVFNQFTLGAYGGALYNQKVADTKINNISGATLNSGAYILWARDALTGAFTIKKIYDAPVKGYVTGVNMEADTLTFSALGYNLTGQYSGTTIGYGIAKLPGATWTALEGGYPIINSDNAKNPYTPEQLIGIKWDLQFQVVQYIADPDRGGKIVAVISEIGAANPVVIDSYQGFTTLGYLREQVVLNDGTLKIINISKINDYPLFTVGGYGMYSGLSSLGKAGWSSLEFYFYHGQLLVGSEVDQLDTSTTHGNWMVYDEYYNGEYYNFIAGIKSKDNSETDEEYDGELNKNLTLTFWNGIAYEGIKSKATVVENYFISTYTKGDDKQDYANNPFSFTAKAEMVLITPAANGGFSVAKGIPVNGSMLTIPAGTKIYVNGQYIYMLPPEGKYVTFTGMNNSNTWNTNTTAGEDIVYFAGYRNNGPVMDTNMGALFNQYGTLYKYVGGYWSLLTGKANGDVAGAIYSDNALLATGFYTVKNAVVDGATVKFFDKKVDFSTLVKDINNGDFQIRPTYLLANGGTYSYELKISETTGKASIELNRANVFVQTWVGGAAGRDTAAPAALGAGKVYLALEYALLENDSGYIPSTSKYYFVIDQVDMKNLSWAYDVIYNTNSFTAVPGAVNVDPTIELAYVGGEIGFNVTAKIDKAYYYNDEYFGYADKKLTGEKTVFIPLTEFGKWSNTYKIDLANATSINGYSVNYSLSGDQLIAGVAAPSATVKLFSKDGVAGLEVTSTITSDYKYNNDKHFTANGTQFIPFTDFNAAGVYTIQIAYNVNSADYDVLFSLSGDELIIDKAVPSVTDKVLKVVGGVLGFETTINLPDSYKLDGDSIFTPDGYIPNGKMTKFIPLSSFNVDKDYVVSINYNYVVGFSSNRTSNNASRNNVITNFTFSHSGPGSVSGFWTTADLGNAGGGNNAFHFCDDAIFGSQDDHLYNLANAGTTDTDFIPTSAFSFVNGQYVYVIQVEDSLIK